MVIDTIKTLRSRKFPNMNTFKKNSSIELLACQESTPVQNFNGIPRTARELFTFK